LAFSPGGAAFKPLTLNAADAQLLEARRFNVEDIARLFRVPVSLLVILLQAQCHSLLLKRRALSFVQHSLRPLLERLEQSLSGFVA
jgi:phage portal protein BeeE